MIERSLSQLYREGLQAPWVRRHAVDGDGDADGDAFDAMTQQLADGAMLDAMSLETLARMPDALAVRGIAAELPRWSQALSGAVASEQAPRNIGVTRAAPRVRSMGRRSWLGVAVAAGLAMFVLGVGQRDLAPTAADSAVADVANVSTGIASDDSSNAASGAVASSVGGLAGAHSADVLFLDPDASLLAASAMPSTDSIFVDSLDG